MGALKRQHLKMLQRAIDDTSCCLSICTTIIAKPGLLKITLYLGFPMDHGEELGKSLHQFGMVQHTSSTRKVLKSRAEQHQVIAGGGTAPSLADAATLTATNGVSLPATMAMAQRAHAHMRVVLVTLLGQDHSTVMAMQDINAYILESEIELENYTPLDRVLKALIHALITQWVHIWLSD